MHEVDPGFISPYAWSLIGENLIYLILFVGSMLVMALCMAFSLGFIPSLVTTGHIPSSLGKIRLPLLLIGAAAVVSAAAMLFIMLPGMKEALATIYTRYLI